MFSNFWPFMDMHRRYVCFGLVMGASSALNNLFVTFYLDLFMNVVKLDSSAFYVGQLVFMVWNSLNDPLFGWISDHGYLPYLGYAAGESSIKRRLSVIRVGGVLWALAFVLVWFPPLNWGRWVSCLHFSVVLCFYDGMLTLVEVNHSALLADISTNGAERAKFNAFSAVCAGVGSLSSFFGYWCWDRSGAHALGRFQLMSVLVAAACAIAFEGACRGMLRDEKVIRSDSFSVGNTNCSACGPGTGSESTLKHEYRKNKKSGSFKETAHKSLNGVAVFVRQLVQNRNFLVFQSVYFIQAFDCTFEKNHFSIFLDGLAGDVYSPGFLGFVVTASFLLPWIGTVFMTPAVQKYGVHSVVSGILLSRISWCAFALTLGPATPGFSVWFILSNRVMSEALCRICPLVVSDLVDEDRFLHQRDKSMSATIVGASALLGKGSQSLAPMFGFYFLSNSSFEKAQQYWTMTLLIVVPLVCVFCQSLLWQMFTLHGKYLGKVKAFVSGSGEFTV